MPGAFVNPVDLSPSVEQTTSAQSPSTRLVPTHMTSAPGEIEPLFLQGSGCRPRPLHQERFARCPVAAGLGTSRVRFSVLWCDRELPGAYKEKTND